MGEQRSLHDAAIDLVQPSTEAPTFDGDSFDALLRDAARLSGQSGASLRCPAPGDVVGGKYRIERLLGAGGMGAVFEVTHTEIAKRFALKWMLAGALYGREAKQRLLREARAACRVASPDVVEVYDVGEDGEVPFLVMELLEGEPLAARIARAPLRVAEAVEILSQVLRATERLHAAGVVHRDLKPANIFLLAEPHGSLRIKVLDFGISKIKPEEHELGTDTTITQLGAVVGTPVFMSPEQLGGQTVDGRTDIYALGVCMFVMLTGKLPWSARSHSELLYQITHDAMPLVSDSHPELPKALARTVSKAMAPDAGQRFATALAFDAALREAMAPQRLAGRRSSVLALVLVAVAAASAWAAWREPATPASTAAASSEATPVSSAPVRPPVKVGGPRAAEAAIDRSGAEQDARPIEHPQPPAARRERSIPIRPSPRPVTEPTPSDPVAPPSVAPHAESRAGALRVEEF